MGKRATLQDIANYCSLSKSMVAYVIREPNACKATEETKAAIAAAVRELNYMPNLTARRLRTQRSKLIGIAFPSLLGYYHELQLEIEAELERHGYYSISTHWNHKAADIHQEILHALNRLCCQQVDGIISCHHDFPPTELSVPIVYYGEPQSTADCVFPDLADYSHKVIQYLFKMGHRKIGYMGYYNDIRKGFIIREMQGLGLEIRTEWFMYALATLENGYIIMQRFLELKERPTAIIVHSDQMAIAAMRAAIEAGVKIPDEISFISFDGLQESAYLNPALTTFHISFQQAAMLLVQTILHRLDDPKMPLQQRTISVSLIERESVQAMTSSIISGYRSLEVLPEHSKAY